MSNINETANCKREKSGVLHWFQTVRKSDDQVAVQHLRTAVRGTG
jgi:hypothetical protein